jgi:hypothetical protein
MSGQKGVWENGVCDMLLLCFVLGRIGRMKPGAMITC